MIADGTLGERGERDKGLVEAFNRFTATARRALDALLRSSRLND
jgi:hypothetical protein